MNGLGFPEILTILIVALLIFGPRKLPELGKSLGAGLREFRKSTQGLKEEFEDATRELSGPATQTVKPAEVTVIAAQPQVIRAEAAVPASPTAPAPNGANASEPAPQGRD
ncbi:Sec-independent protein translocase subunit TatA/TatB [Deinococcus fonticola]|uniref:Sec-independent protein translocase subunit TatA/TatB n=1 Tax=Deinococcus fonticola TaxID=2528713 RepID=UPI001074D5F3|nr:twin-arginine translocase TatA/TatE family subunit [Deinococcus fonticola]